jgi:hypothetical protein
VQTVNKTDFFPDNPENQNMLRTADLMLLTIHHSGKWRHCKFDFMQSTWSASCLTDIGVVKTPSLNAMATGY